MASVWSLLLGTGAPPGFFQDELHEWLANNVVNQQVSHDGLPWCLIFGVAVDTIWHSRNLFVFEHVSSEVGAVVSEILAKAKGYRDAMASGLEQVVLDDAPNMASIRWFPPENGSVKLYTDGSFSSSRNMASCGGVVRDHLGVFLVAFAREKENWREVKWQEVTNLESVRERERQVRTRERESVCVVVVVVVAREVERRKLNLESKGDVLD
ncbi:RNA-directed DNA polymerase (Reverse transcriptase) [Trifolium medium]|uniref:RNA-directed DNA polymerase (Reverse transcriptase) n=1 Tax=Trifolium medium TaxID=97028 RepID=A0A392MXA2_9FABA|nr:RNA-directed DNA polymerase (Reverse transcriptase) [Trifolium medium]